MAPYELFLRRFGQAGLLGLWNRFVEIAWGIPSEDRRVWRERLLSELGLPTGTSEHLNSVACTAFSRLCRRALRRDSAAFSDGDLLTELRRSLENREILLAWSAAENDREAVERLAAFAAACLGAGPGMETVSYLLANRKLRQFDGSGRLGAWLRATRRRLGRRAGDDPSPGVDLDRIPSPLAGPIEEVTFAEALCRQVREAADVRRALAAVPRAGRRLIVRRYVCRRDWTLKELSEAEDVLHPSTISRRLARAMDLFLAALGTREGPAPPTWTDLIAGCACSITCPEVWCEVGRRCATAGRREREDPER